MFVKSSVSEATTVDAKTVEDKNESKADLESSSVQNKSKDILTFRPSKRLV